VARPSWAAWGALAVILFVVAKACASVAGRPTEPSPAAVAVEPAQPLPKLDVAELRRAYKANQVAADAKYQGKRFQVTGTVVKVDSGLTGEPSVWLGSEVDPVVADGMRKEFAATLKKTDPVSAACTVRGEVVDTLFLDCGAP
jgi:hypothetical protein